MSELIDKLEQYINIYSDRLEPAKKLEAATYIRNLEANQRLIRVVREALAELRHTKVPNKRFVTLINQKLKELDKSDQEAISVSRWASWVVEYGFYTVHVQEKRCYQAERNTARYEEEVVRLSWPVSIYDPLPEGGHVARSGNTWEEIEAQINREDSADSLERLNLEIESTIQTDLSLINFRIHDLQNVINGLRVRAEKLIANQPVPTVAITRKDNMIWSQPSLLTRLAYPDIWPPAPRR